MKKKLILAVGSAIFYMVSVLSAGEISENHVSQKDIKSSFYWTYGYDSELGINTRIGNRTFHNSYGFDANFGVRVGIVHYGIEGSLNFLYFPSKIIYLGLGAKGGTINLKNSRYKDSVWHFSPQAVVGIDMKNKFYQIEINPFIIYETEKKVKENPSLCFRVGHYF
jgi:hypothetical protein